MKERIRILFLISTLTLGIGCANKSVVSVPTGQTVLIDTKAQFKDLRKDKTQNAKIQVFLLRNQAVRMEVTAVFGYQIASIVMTPKKIQYALHTSKQFAEGPFSARTLFPVFKQNIDPRLLWNVIHGKNPETGDLKCEKDANERPLSCVSTTGNVEVKWTYQDDIKRRIDIKNQQFEMNWIFREQSLYEGPAQNETFVLKKPLEYEEIAVK